MIIFVADEPSKHNKDPRIPLVGTKSNKRFHEWIYRMELDVTGIMVANRSQVMAYDWNTDGDGVLISTVHFETDLGPNDAVVALGNKASDHLKRLGVEHFKLPHPSGLCRKNNDKKYVDQVLKECQSYINERYL